MLAIGTPYKENSVSAIARVAAKRVELDAFYTTIYTAKLIPAIEALPLGRFRTPILRELKRRAYVGVPMTKVRTLATIWDLALFAIRRLNLSELSSRFTFEVKRRFDGAMARAVARSGARAVVGMWGSCEATFELARSTGRYTVMNYVNSHPSEQNRLMRDYGQAPAGHHEYVPQNIVEQVERETALADLILVPSQFVARQLIARGTPESRILVEPYGVDLHAFTPPARQRDFRNIRRLQVLCVALISYRKGTRDLLAAAREMTHDADFHLIGPTIEPALLDRLPPNVTYHGIKVQSEVVSAMQEADVLILPSVEDSYALVILEAMATALPVVVSDHVGGAESITDGETGFIFPVADVARLVSCLQLLHAEPDRRERMGLAARDFVERSSSWETYADRVLNRIIDNCKQHKAK